MFLRLFVTASVLVPAVTMAGMAILLGEISRSGCFLPGKGCGEPDLALALSWFARALALLIAATVAVVALWRWAGDRTVEVLYVLALVLIVWNFLRS